MHKYDYGKLIGALLSNLHALEFSIRAFLYARSDPPHTPLVIGSLPDSVQVGSIVTENAYTDFSSLGKLIDRYNHIIGETNPELRLDRSLVTLRDAIVHGRISSLNPSDAPTLLKFKKPTGNFTSVEFAQSLTPDWLKAQIIFVYSEVMKIGKAPGTPILPD